MPRIHHLTDTHYPRADSRVADYVAALKRGALGPPPDLIVHTGDLVDGAQDPQELRRQHQELHAMLETTGIPVLALAHTHDRMGERQGDWGRTFSEIWNQPLARIVALPGGIDLCFLSGSVTQPPLSGPEEVPEWGFDVFDYHVLEALEELVARDARPDSYRVLCTHLPVLLEPGFPRPGDRYQRPPIGTEGVSRILPTIERLGIRLVLGGHIHKASRHCAGDTEFIVGSACVGDDAGFGLLTFANGIHSYEFHSLPS